MFLAKIIELFDPKNLQCTFYMNLFIKKLKKEEPRAKFFFME